MKIIIADGCFLSRVGLEYVIQNKSDISEYIVSQVAGFRALSQQIKLFLPDMVMLDYVSMHLSPEDVQVLMIKYPNIKFIFITDWLPKEELLKYFRLDVKWHLLKECDEKEISDCIQYAKNNQSFLCNRIVQYIQNKEEVPAKERSAIHCNGVSITQRERDIIELIAEGLSNKQIADNLNLSIHTVLTHRKNIMKKTNANNTAGLVLFALKNNIIAHTNRFLFARNG